MRNKRQLEVWYGVAMSLALCLCVFPAQAQGGTQDRIESARDQAALREADQAEVARDTSVSPSTPPIVGHEAGAASASQAATPEPEVREIENQPLGGRSSSGFGAADGTKSKNDGWVLQTLGALGFVIALILLAKYLVKKGVLGGRFAGAAVRSNADAVVEVLSRTSIAPRNNILLLRVGHRILVVNESAGAMRTLATVDDPDEVAGLLQSVQSTKAASMSTTFAGVMSKVAGQWGADAEDGGSQDRSEPATTVANPDQPQANPIASLRGKLRAMAGTGQGGGA